MQWMLWQFVPPFANDYANIANRNSHQQPRPKQISILSKRHAPLTKVAFAMFVGAVFVAECRSFWFLINPCFTAIKSGRILHQIQSSDVRNLCNLGIACATHLNVESLDLRKGTAQRL